MVLGEKVPSVSSFVADSHDKHNTSPGTCHTKSIAILRGRADLRLIEKSSSNSVDSLNSETVLSSIRLEASETVRCKPTA